jgi:uncharacterized protein YqfA (UPF0365 family)
VTFGLDTVIVAIIGALATIYGIREARAGRRDATIQQAAANRLADEKQELDALRFVIESERTEADRAKKDRNEAREEADAERKRRMSLEAELRAEVNTERTRRVQIETEFRVLSERCREDARRHAEEYGELLLLVRETIGREAGRTEVAIEAAEGHRPP